MSSENKKVTVIGYIVRMIHEEDRVKDVAYDPKSHVLYPTFDEVLKAAEAIAKKECDRVNGKLIAVVTQKSEAACAKKGYAQLFEITGNYKVYAHALRS